MLSRTARLRTAEVALVLRKGRPSGTGRFVSARALAGGRGLRAAAVVSKAVAKRAVARNRLRRALYRELATADTSGTNALAVFFIKRIPAEDLAGAFRDDLRGIVEEMKKLKFKNNNDDAKSVG